MINVYVYIYIYIERERDRHYPDAALPAEIAAVVVAVAVSALA